MPADAPTNVQARGRKGALAPLVIDAALCKACGICAGICPSAALRSGPEGVPYLERPQDCTTCRMCELHCPEFAVAVRAREKRRAAGARTGQG